MFLSESMSGAELTVYHAENGQEALLGAVYAERAANSAKDGAKDSATKSANIGPCTQTNLAAVAARDAADGARGASNQYGHESIDTVWSQNI